MTKAQYKRIIIKATREYKLKHPDYIRYNLTGRNHIKGRSCIFNTGFANLIPDDASSSLYYTGQGQITIVGTDYIKFIAKKINVPVDFITLPVWDKPQQTQKVG